MEPLAAIETVCAQEENLSSMWRRSVIRAGTVKTVQRETVRIEYS